jgi:hypothetical protein
LIDANEAIKRLRVRSPSFVLYYSDVRFWP